MNSIHLRSSSFKEVEQNTNQHKSSGDEPKQHGYILPYLDAYFVLAKLKPIILNDINWDIQHERVFENLVYEPKH